MAFVEEEFRGRETREDGLLVDSLAEVPGAAGCGSGLGVGRRVLFLRPKCRLAE